MSKIHAEIEYQKEDGTWVHSDICPPECSPDNLEYTFKKEFEGEGDHTYREYLHNCLDEWLDKSKGTGMFYIKNEKFKPDLYFGDEDPDAFTDVDRIDWLERNSFDKRTVAVINDKLKLQNYIGINIREAIDKAMRENI